MIQGDVYESPDKDRKRNEQFSVRIQVQGEIVENIRGVGTGGIAETFGGRRNVPVTGVEALAGLEKLKEKTIERVGKKDYEKYYAGAFDKAQRFTINAMKGGGVEAIVKYPAHAQSVLPKHARVDIEILEGRNLQ